MDGPNIVDNETVVALLPFTGLITGALAGAAVALLTHGVSAWGFRKNRVYKGLARHSRWPFSVMLVVWGAWAGFVLTAPADPPIWHRHVGHALLIVAIMTVGWTAYTALYILTDVDAFTDVRSGRDVRRFRTQAQVLRRAAQALTVFLTATFVLLTFPEARAPIGSILASAGLLSVVAGLAAQTTLSNVFAGLQIAFTDALRVGDNIVVPGEDQPGRVEELTLTYVVLRIWDERRMILPSSQFTSQGFENWTRRSAAQLAAFSIEVDWTAPVAEIRAELKKLLDSTDLWDGRTWSLQVYDLKGPYMTLRITISGANWARLQDLRAYLRENLVAWIRQETPWAIPRERMIMSEAAQVHPVMGTEVVDEKLLAAPTLTGPFGGGEFTKEELAEPDPDRQYSAVNASEEAEKDEGEAEAEAASEPPASETPPTGTKDGLRLFSGSREGEHRAALYSGPGSDTLWNRTLRALQRTKDEKSIPVHGNFDEDIVKQAEDEARAADAPSHPSRPASSVEEKG